MYLHDKDTQRTKCSIDSSHCSCVFPAKCNAGQEVQEIGGNYECVLCDIDFYQPVDTPTIDDRCTPCDTGFGTRATGSSECEGKVV